MKRDFDPHAFLATIGEGCQLIETNRKYKTLALPPVACQKSAQVRLDMR